MLFCSVETHILFSQVCFHCRKPGHGIADCPAALENQDMGTGICYRCGSTEHEITKCKAKVDPALGMFFSYQFLICLIKSGKVANE